MNVKLLVGFAVVFLLLLIGTASASTLVVNQTSPACTTGDKYYSTIQDAVNAAKDGDTIIVCPGTYNENVIVNKSLEIRSYSQNPADTVVIAFNYQDHVFDVNADNVTISGFKVTGATGNFKAGIRLYFSDNSIIENVYASNNQNGIFLKNSDNNTIRNNIISNNWNGIRLRNSNNNIIRNNNISNNGGADSGISLYKSNYNIIYLNNFINNTGQVYSSNSENIWNSTKKITYTYKGKQFKNYLGNYWSDYTGSDANGDGIGDDPYPINGDADNYPLMQPWENYFQPVPVPALSPIGIVVLACGIIILAVREL